MAGDTGREGAFYRKFRGFRVGEGGAGLSKKMAVFCLFCHMKPERIATTRRVGRNEHLT